MQRRPVNFFTTPPSQHVYQPGNFLPQCIWKSVYRLLNRRIIPCHSHTASLSLFCASLQWQSCCDSSTCSMIAFHPLPNPLYFLPYLVHIFWIRHINIHVTHTGWMHDIVGWLSLFMCTCWMWNSWLAVIRMWLNIAPQNLTPKVHTCTILHRNLSVRLYCMLHTSSAHTVGHVKMLWTAKSIFTICLSCTSPHCWSQNCNGPCIELEITAISHSYITQDVLLLVQEHICTCMHAFWVCHSKPSAERTSEAMNCACMHN